MILRLLLLLALVFVQLGCQSDFVEKTTIAKGVVIEHHYSWWDREQEMVTALPRSTRIRMEDGSVFRFPRSKKEAPDAVFVGCDHLWIERHSDFGTFLYVLCDDGDAIPVWDWSTGFNAHEAFWCDRLDENELLLKVRCQDLMNSHYFTEEKKIVVTSSFAECQPFRSAMFVERLARCTAPMGVGN